MASPVVDVAADASFTGLRRGRHRPEVGGGRWWWEAAKKEWSPLSRPWRVERMLMASTTTVVARRVEEKAMSTTEMTTTKMNAEKIGTTNSPIKRLQVRMAALTAAAAATAALTLAIGANPAGASVEGDDGAYATSSSVVVDSQGAGPAATDGDQASVTVEARTSEANTCQKLGHCRRRFKVRYTGA